jgi:hypothetical protein
MVKFLLNSWDWRQDPHLLIALNVQDVWLELYSALKSIDSLAHPLLDSTSLLYPTTKKYLV